MKKKEPVLSVEMPSVEGTRRSERNSRAPIQPSSPGRMQPHHFWLVATLIATASVQREFSGKAKHYEADVKIMSKDKIIIAQVMSTLWEKKKDFFTPGEQKQILDLVVCYF